MRLDAQIPKVIAGYRLVRLLGRGGMAEVWLANKIDDPLEKPWVVKVMLPEFATSAKHRERFLSEVQTLASLNHGCIVTIHGHGEDQGFLYLVMRYIDGVNLRVFVQGLAANGERIPIPGVVFIIAAVADALRHAHTRPQPGGGLRGVIHRDVNPSNILVSSDGEVFLTDFGLARYEQDFSMEMFGTTAYVAPEQARGAACAQSDLFGLGGALHFMLTGKPPRSVNAAELHKALDRPPPPIGRDDVPELLEQIHALALAPALADRFESAADILELIEAYKAYKRGTTLLAQLYLRHFGPPKTGMTEAVAMASIEPNSTVPLTAPPLAPPPLAPPPQPKVDLSTPEDQVTTFWQPPAPPCPTPDEPLVEKVPPEYRPAPGSRAEADAPKVRRRPRRDGSDSSEPPRPEPTEILRPPVAAAGSPTTEPAAKDTEPTEPEPTPKDTAPPAPEPGDRAAAAPSSGSTTEPSPPVSDQAPSANTSIVADEPSVEPEPASPPVRNEARTAVELRRTPKPAAPVHGRGRTVAGTLMGITAAACVAALGVAFMRGDVEPRHADAVEQAAAQSAPSDAAPVSEVPPVDDGRVALGAAARSDDVEPLEDAEEPEAVATSSEPKAKPGTRIPVVIVIAGIEGSGGEVEVGDERIPLDPIANTALPPGRYPLRWRNAPSAEWQDAGTVDVMPEDVHNGLLRVQVSPTEGARVERRQ